MMPGRLQIGTHSQQTLTLLGTQNRRALSDQRLQLLLQLVYGREGGIPSPLEFASDQTIVRIDRIILPARPSRLVSRLFEHQFDLALFLASLVLAVRDHTDRRLNAERLEQSHDLGSHRLVNPQSAERDTGGGLRVAPGRVAMITTDVALRTVVADKQSASAMAAAQQASEQSLPLAHRAAHHRAFAWIAGYR